MPLLSTYASATGRSYGARLATPDIQLSISPALNGSSTLTLAPGTTTEFAPCNITWTVTPQSDVTVVAKPGRRTDRLCAKAANHARSFRAGARRPRYALYRG